MTSRVLLAVLVVVAGALLLVRACDESPGVPDVPAPSPTTTSDGDAPPRRARVAAVAESAPAPDAHVDVAVRVALPEGVRGASVEVWDLPQALEVADCDVDDFRPATVTFAMEGWAAADASGAASVAARPGIRLFVVRAPGFAPAARVVVLAEGGAPPPLDVAPVPGVVLRGVVLGPEGEPAPGVRVVAAPVAMTEVLGHDALCARATTARLGTFELRDLAPGDHALWVGGPRGVSALRRVHTVRVPAVSDVELRLVRGVRITGVVLDDATGEPVRDAIVSLAEAESWPRVGTVEHAAAPCEAGGRFELRSGLPDASRAALVVHAPGFARLPTRVAFDDVERLVDGAHRDVVLRVARGATVLGAVRGPDGPVAGCVVRVEPKDATYGAGWDALWRDVTGADGLYRIDGVPPGEFELTAGIASPDGPGGDAVLARAASPGDVVTLDVRLVRAPTLRGRVVDRTGAPIAGALVTWSGGATPGTTRTRADGSFELVAPTQGEVHVVLTVRHPSWCAWDGLVGEEGDPLARTGEVGDIELAAPVRLAGRVTETDGTPVAGARVRLICGEPGQDCFVATLDAVAACVTAADGRYAFVTQDRCPGVYAFHPEDGRWISRWDAPDEGADDLDLVFPSEARLAGRVVDATDGAPLPGVLVSPSWHDAPAVARTGADGRFTYLADGQTPSSVTFSRNGYRSADVELSELTDAQRADVVVRMVRVARVTGVVRAADGTPRPGLWVWLRSGDTSEVTRTDASGRFLFDEREIETVTVFVTGGESADDEGERLAEATVVPGAGDVTLVLK